MLASLVVLEHRVALLNGNLGAAAEAARWLARLGAPGETLLLKAWTEAAAGRHDAARRTWRRCTPRARRSSAGHRWWRRACSRPRRRCRPTTASRAGGAGGRARRGGGHRRRPAVRAGRAAAPRSCWAPAGAADRSAFAAQVAAARAAVVADPAVLLSEREMAVLALLPSLLNAREIADEFTVSVNTVKSHIRSIYAKLGVSSRREAVGRRPGPRAAALSRFMRAGVRRAAAVAAAGWCPRARSLPARMRRRSIMPDRRYEVRVTGRLSQRARDAFAGMDVAEVTAETVISGVVHQDDELHELLAASSRSACTSSPCSRWRPDPARPPRAAVPETTGSWTRTVPAAADRSAGDGPERPAPARGWGSGARRPRPAPGSGTGP